MITSTITATAVRQSSSWRAISEIRRFHCVVATTRRNYAIRGLGTFDCQQQPIAVTVRASIDQRQPQQQQQRQHGRRHYCSSSSSGTTTTTTRSKPATTTLASRHNPPFSFDLTDLRQAAALVYHHGVIPTLQYAWPLLAERTQCACVVVKHENHTPVGAFKVRGGIVYMDWLTRQDEYIQKNVNVRGIIAATRGNHGQSIAFAARQHKIPVHIVVPHGNSVEKNAAMRALGAQVIEFGNDFEEAHLEAERLAKTEGLWMVPSFDEQLVKGVATYALELFEAVKDIDTVYVPIGLGSGICGLIQTRNLLGLHKTKIVGVVTDILPAYALSFEKGEIVTTDAAGPQTTTIADGMATRAPVQEALDCILHGGADRIVRVSDDEIVNAIRAYYTDTHNLAEGAGASPLAALLQEREQMEGKRVAVILCGGNIDLDWFHKHVLNGSST